MPGDIPFDYSIVRIVPRVEREEFLNVGIILYCRVKKFLDVRLIEDLSKLKAIYPEIDLDQIRSNLDALPNICAGKSSGGPIGLLPQHERWHWLVAPRSTIIQTSPVHSGLCSNPELELDQLFKSHVL